MTIVHALDSRRETAKSYPQIIQCEQGTETWFRARMGMATASEFSTVMASGRGGGESKTRRKYLLQLADEIRSGEPKQEYTNPDMERGKVMEADARSWYGFIFDIEPERVGFVVNGVAGCSPDALIRERGILEIKTACPHVLADFKLRGEFPLEHKAQCQGSLWVAEREWIDLLIYWPKRQPFYMRAYRDERFIQLIIKAVQQFNDELQEIVGRLDVYDTSRSR